MKKLMITAAVAAMIASVNAAALPEDDDIINDEGVGSLYNVAISVKTLESDWVRVSKGKSIGCAICPTEIPEQGCLVLEQTTVKVNGIVAFCGCDIGDAGATFWYGSGKKATPFTCGYDGIAPESYEDLLTLDEAGVTGWTLERYSKKANKAALSFELESVYGDTFTGKGFGSYTAAKYKANKEDGEIVSYDLKTPAKFSVSGSVTGEHTLIQIVTGTDEEGNPEFDTAGTWNADPCTVAVSCLEENETEKVPLFGTFTFKSGSVSKKLDKVIPATVIAAPSAN